MRQQLQRIPLGVDEVGEYCILSLLGSGALGRVYHAQHRRTGQSVALKVLSLPSADADLLRQVVLRFEREVLVLRTLSHPHLVRVVDSGHLAVGGAEFPWLAMDLIPGARSIGAAYRERPDVAWLLDRVEEILETLDYLHGQGIIHRDIKPDNVLLGENGQGPYLVDFGLVRVAELNHEQLTQTGQALGTLQYMALEQMGSARHVDARADLYSVGMMVFELLEDIQDWHPYMTDILCAAGLTFTRPVAPPLARFVERLAAPRLEDRLTSAQQALDDLRTMRTTL